MAAPGTPDLKKVAKTLWHIPEAIDTLPPLIFKDVVVRKSMKVPTLPDTLIIGAPGIVLFETKRKKEEKEEKEELVVPCIKKAKVIEEEDKPSAKSLIAMRRKRNNGGKFEKATQWYYAHNGEKVVV